MDTLTTAAGNTPGRPAPPVRFADPVKNAAYWARIDAIVATAPPLTDEQRAVIRVAFGSVRLDRAEVA